VWVIIFAFIVGLAGFILAFWWSGKKTKITDIHHPGIDKQLDSARPGQYSTEKPSGRSDSCSNITIGAVSGMLIVLFIFLAISVYIYTYPDLPGGLGAEARYIFLEIIPTSMVCIPLAAIAGAIGGLIGNIITVWMINRFNFRRMRLCRLLGLSVGGALGGTIAFLLIYFVI
jgi:hypothetical protein